jgi:hypothetical protein
LFSRELLDSLNKTNKQDKLFFFYSQKSINTDEKSIELCEKLARQCDELKVQLFFRILMNNFLI